MGVSKKFTWILILLLVSLGVGIIPMTILRAEQKRMDLFFKDPTARTPLTLSFSTQVLREGGSRLSQALYGLRMGTKQLSGTMNLEIGPKYRREATLFWRSFSFGAGGFTGPLEGFAIYGNFSIPASELVPYMIHETDEEGNIIDPYEGTLEFRASYEFKISDTYGEFRGVSSGTTHIRVVGEISEYLEEAGIDPEAEGVDHDPGSEDEFNLDDTGQADDSGASRVYTDWLGGGFSLGLSIPLMIIIGIIVIIILRKG